MAKLNTTNQMVREFARVLDGDDGLDSEGYPIGSPREWSDEELKELRRRERACDDYGSM